LVAGSTVEVDPNSTKGAGLSISILQGSTLLYNWDCHPANSFGSPFDLVEDNTPLHVIVEPYNYGENDLCSANAKHSVNLSLNCLPGRATSNTIDVNIKEFSFYPNPFKNTVHIESKYGDLVKSLSLINASGQKIISHQNLNTKEFDLDTQDILSGIYFLTITSSNSSESIKIIKVE